MFGTTVVSAATAKITKAADDAETLAEVTGLVETCLLADLADAYPPVLAALDVRAALDADVGHLMSAIPALARTLRYGDVRKTDVEGLATVTASLLTSDVKIHTLDRYHLGSPRRRGIVLGYGVVDLPEIERGLSLLHNALLRSH